MQENSLLDFLLRKLDEHRVEDIEVINVGDRSSLANYLIIGTGRSGKHMESTIEKLRLALKQNEIAVGVPEGRNSGWIVLDLGNIMLHLFTEEDRRKYDLSKLWNREMRSGTVQL
ncbi:MAG: ribosome silencing factor [Rickettsiales bacterium]|nr:ribosome silencing factor [Rickettsiales bacterium]